MNDQEKKELQELEKQIRKGVQFATTEATPIDI